MPARRMARVAARLTAAWLSLFVGVALSGCASPWPLDSVAPDDSAAEATDGEAAPDDSSSVAADSSAPSEPQPPDRETAAKLRRDLSSPQAMARVKALEQLLKTPPETLPTEVVEARSDPDPRVRSKALEVVAAVAAADAIKHLERGLRDESRDVRHAAMRGLGHLRSDEATAKLRELWKQEPETTRVVLVEALAECQDLDTVLQAAEDKVWQVRAAAAPAVARLGDGAANLAALERLAADASSVVQAAAVEAVADWPLDAAGSVWLVAMEHGGTRARIAAQKRLREHWSAAESFDPEADRDLRIRQLAELRGQWQARRATLPAPAAQLAAATTRPEVTQALDELASQDPQARRLAAKSLVVLSRRQPLGPAACQRLADELTHETDADVWRSVLEALTGDASSEATHLALLASGMSDGDVRRRACAYLAEHPAPEAATRLGDLLHDPELAVRRAAAQALGGCAGPEQIDALVEALTSRDGPLRVAAATSLARAHHEAGLPALERLAHDPDLNVRLAAAGALGEVGGPAAQGALVDLLDEPYGVGLAAMRALRKAAEDAATGATPVPPGPQSAEIAEWKRWWREQSQLK